VEMLLADLPAISKLLEDANAGNAPARAALDAIEGVVSSAQQKWARKVCDWECAFADNVGKWARGDADEDERWAPVLNARHPRRGKRVKRG